MEAFTDVHCGTGEHLQWWDECVQILIYQISINMHSGFHQIALEGTKGASGFVALDDIEYTTGINCDDQRVDPKPGEMNRWRE